MQLSSVLSAGASISPCTDITSEHSPQTRGAPAMYQLVNCLQQLSGAPSVAALMTPRDGSQQAAVKDNSGSGRCDLHRR